MQPGDEGCVAREEIQQSLDVEWRVPGIAHARLLSETGRRHKYVTVKHRCRTGTRIGIRQRWLSLVVRGASVPRGRSRPTRRHARDLNRLPWTVRMVLITLTCSA
jgi:hypothetical protein